MNASANASRPERRDQGQSLVEFALVIPVLAVIVFAIVQFGFLFAGQIGLANAVRDAARTAAVNQGADATRLGVCTTTGSLTGTNAQKAYQSLLNRLPVQVPGYQSSRLVAGCTAVTGYTDTSARFCSYRNADGTTYSIRLILTAVYRHPLFVPLVGTIVDAFDGTTDSGCVVRRSDGNQGESDSATGRGQGRTIRRRTVSNAERWCPHWPMASRPNLRAA